MTLKQIPMKQTGIMQLEFVTTKKLAKNPNNFITIFLFDQHIRLLQKERKAGKFDSDTFRLLALSHIKYFYNLDYTKEYKKYLKMYGIRVSQLKNERT